MKKLSDQALAVLSECTVTANEVVINSGQLDRKLYLEVDTALRGLGAKWDRKAKAHIFDPTENVRELLEGCIQTGLAVPLHPNGYFKTPDATADLLVREARLFPGCTVLEPSAGDGQIVRAILRSNPSSKIQAVEFNATLVAGGFDVPHDVAIAIGDFLAMAHLLQPVDRVVMNPPFLYNSDTDHVLQAWALLKPKGRLVSVMSAGATFRREKKVQAFRDLVEEHGRFEKLPDGTFKHSGTMVNTVMVVLDK